MKLVIDKNTAEKKKEKNLKMKIVEKEKKKVLLSQINGSRKEREAELSFAENKQRLLCVDAK